MPTQLRAVLFVDIVASTEARRDLGDRVADEVFTSLLARLDRAVAAVGGTTVKHLGDGAMAVFDAAATALASAAEMQHSVTHRNRSGETPIEISIGVSVGEVSWDGADAHGMPVVEAARLCDKATAGQVLATDLVRSMAGTRTPVPLEPIGALDLKGIGSVDVVTARWEAIAPADRPREQIALPTPLADRFHPLFVGRRSVVDTLAATVGSEDATGVRLELLIGEAGIGKTTLAAEVARHAHRFGSVVLYGRCDRELRTPYGPFAAALKTYATEIPTDRLADLLGPGASSLSTLDRMLADVDGIGPAEFADPETQRARLFDAVARWLATAGGDQPLILVLDDLHWADQDTLLLLRHLVQFDTTSAVSIIGTYRHTDVDAGSPFTGLLGELRRDGNIGRYQLDGLQLDEVTELVDSRLAAVSRESSTEIAPLILELTGGNPYFLHEVLRHLAEADDAVEATHRLVEGLQHGNVDLPAALGEAIEGRLSSFGPDIAAVLSTAAVIGRDFATDVLLATTDADPALVGTALDAATTLELVRVSGHAPLRYEFTHALIHAVLYNRLGSFERATTHAAVGASIESLHADDLSDDAAALANHFDHALDCGGSVDKAIAAAKRAGHVARFAAAPREAAYWFGRCLALLPRGDSDQRCQALWRLGQAQLYSADPVWLTTLTEAAEMAGRLGDGAQMATILHASGRMGLTSYETPDLRRRELVREALELIEPDDLATRSLMLGVLTGETMLDRTDESFEHATAAVESVRGLTDDPMSQLTVYGYCATALVRPAQLALRTECIDALTALDDKLAIPWVTLNVASARSTHLTQIGDMAALREQTESVREMVERGVLPTWSWIHKFYTADLKIVDGRPDEAIDLCDQAAHHMHEMGERDADFLPTTFRSLFMFYAGRFEEAAPMLAPLAHKRGTFGSAKAGHLASIGAPAEEVVAAWEGASRWFFDAPVVDLVRAQADLDAAATMRRFFAHDAGDFLLTMGSITLPRAWALGVLASVAGDIDEADAHFARAEELEIERGAITLLARIHVDWASALLADDPERARQLVDRARPVVDDIGIADLHRRIAQLTGKLLPRANA